MISKRLPLIFLFGAVFSTSAFGRHDSLLARITVYWARGGGGTDRYTRQHKSSTGLRLQQGHCAVDPKKIPYGSQVVLPDGTSLSAVDTGSAVRNRKAARSPWTTGRLPVPYCMKRYAPEAWSSKLALARVVHTRG